MVDEQRKKEWFDLLKGARRDAWIVLLSGFAALVSSMFFDPDVRPLLQIPGLAVMAVGVYLRMKLTKQEKRFKEFDTQ